MNIRLCCPREAVRQCSEALEQHGALAVSVTDIAHPSQRQVTGLFEARTVDPQQICAQLQSASAVDGMLSITVEPVENRNWVLESQRRFEPIRIGNRLWVTAPWHRIDTSASAHVVINPGMSFGTGHHPTTRLCLEFLASCQLGGSVVLDYGCGSGILALAALVLGAAEAVGVDVDPEAIAQSRCNAAANGLTAQYCARLIEHSALRCKARIVVANLSRNVLFKVRDQLAQCTAAGGQLAVSGILAAQADAIRGHYQGLFDLSSRIEMDEWVLLSGLRTDSAGT